MDVSAKDSPGGNPSHSSADHIYENRSFVLEEHSNVIPMNNLGEAPPPPPPYQPSTEVTEVPTRLNGDLPSHNDTKEEEDEDDDDDDEDYSLITLLPFLMTLKVEIKRSIPISDKHWPWVTKMMLTSVLAMAYLMYFIAVLIIKTNLEGDDTYWCDGDGLLIILTALAGLGLLYFQVIKPFFGKTINRCMLKPIGNMVDKAFSHMVVTVSFTLLVIAALLGFLLYDSWDELRRLQSLSGIVVLIAFGFLFSAAPGKVRWRHIIWGLALQFILGLIVLKWSVGQDIFNCLSMKVTTFLSFSDAGSTFVFDILVSKYAIFAFKVLPVTLFFSFCIQILYYFGVMQWIVLKMGWFLHITVGTTACESVNAAANIFLGQTEAPLLIKPYLGKMTKSEIHAVMTGGFATIAGAVMAAYISFGIDAASLLSASVMNAPAALAFSKLFYPEVKKSKTTTADIKIDKGEEVNWLHAAMTGVTNAIPMVAGIAANLICFIAFIELCSHITNWMCMLAGADDGVCRIENLFGWIYMPLAWVLGVDWSECHMVGELIGLKTIVNEFVAYDRLSEMVKSGEISKRAELIATYALCGFSNISSIGIVLGGLGTMAPERKGDMAKIVVRAMIAGSCASFLTSCVAGTLLSDDYLDRNTTITTDIFTSTTTMTSYLQDANF